jgi:hypothetical protein
MLVHESVKMAEHKDTRRHVLEAWRARAYASARGLEPLRTLFETDFRPVSEVRAGEYPVPACFEELEPFVGQALARMRGLDGSPVIVVNGDKDLVQEALDFDAHPVWRILVGGTKLSRGFTVEGLTVSYYRRRTAAADTLMQMGRWFGFREGYADLVRLFIGRREPIGRGFDDLYAKFEAVVRDEEVFREQLRQYAKPVDGEAQVRPDQIPPLVSQHLPTLRPTSPNKMYNAELQVRRSPGTPLEPTAYPEVRLDLAHNFAAALPLLKAATDLQTLPVPKRDLTYLPSPLTFEAYTGVVPHAEVLQSLSAYRWYTPDYFLPDLRYLEEATAQIDDWLVVLPQLAGGSSGELPDVGRRSLIERTRRRGALFGAISDPNHRRACLSIATEGGGTAPVGRSLSRPRRGVLLMYPVVEDTAVASTSPVDESRVVVAFTAITPRTAVGTTSQLVTFRARNAASRRAIIDARQRMD